MRFSNPFQIQAYFLVYISAAFMAILDLVSSQISNMGSFMIYLHKPKLLSTLAYYSLVQQETYISNRFDIDLHKNLETPL